ncbi:hypothetical protein A3E73_01060 [Candidatus Beckwithbacteria bacterium RIFCSPHIGHO2_12_FULL_47_17]|uniref:Uncharacterized protein n=1 Tax=Candidatus Beckwithbacteria bacterium RIFCSPHIGHO2_12_FULL_47_17 TaxID=1797460 RepID=A0A1F5DJP1_9BACT|nr:MAG: hypothetical protein A3E73_01060 [Candidatus Beckwithbacteria bacterium RIFCSPHIGHO2_12_FULL_47_17]
MNEALHQFIRNLEGLKGITYGEFSLDFLYGRQNPFGEFGVSETVIDSRPYYRGWINYPHPTPDSWPGWVRLKVKFAQDPEPLLLRPEQTAQLLAQRPYDEVCLLLSDGTINIPVKAMSQAPNLLRQMEYAYLLKRSKKGELKLIRR